jgi:acetylornithine/N-succinyldiaminopimelate aminotransferase
MSVTHAESLVSRGQAVLMDTYTRQPLVITHGRGVWVTDAGGRELIDMVGGIAVNVLGHCHPAVVAAMQQQSQRLIHTSNLYHTEAQVELAERLIASAFPSRVFFCNSGSEANEGAIKLARKWGRTRRGGAHTIITAQQAFHGRTMGALAATANPRYREPFEPLPSGFIRVPFNDAAAIAGAIDDSTCAVMLEPIQGEAGVYALDDGVLLDIRRICDHNDVLLILDEVQSGMGRTGMWWAHQHERAVPDVMTVAKGLGAGFPIGAILANERADVLQPGDHGCTFGGSPLACTVALAVMRTIEEERLMDNALRVGDHLRERLHELAHDGAPIAEVRGRGLMLGVALSAPVAAQVARAALGHGVIVNAVGEHTLRLVPPLLLSHDEAQEAMLRLQHAFAALDVQVPA